MAITHLSPPAGHVVATLNFYSPPPDGSQPYNIAGDVPPGVTPRNYDTDPQPVLIHDARGKESTFTLDHDAFQVLQHQPPLSISDPHPEPFTSDASIRTNYFPEVERLLLKTVPGATHVIIFDHTLRRTSPTAARQPVARVHIDQTALSAAQRVRRHASSPEEADELLRGRYRIINVWRPLNQRPVESFPLAFASSASLRDEDVIPVEHRYLSTGYVGQTAGIRYHEGQKWYYLSGMTGEERILLECFDSEARKEGSKVKGGRVAHTAFEDPRTREGAEGRESIEVRALVFGP
ncbi:hypothetical protein VTJ49DRAFT_7074 [Mycothermus thermophilus]|uniref:7alpha-cephem-methoxylase P8 chain related protein n=1 Tax=Humicola insolens TaxID=85995 RepID=A0ABR3VIJ4_HUMIN